MQDEGRNTPTIRIDEAGSYTGFVGKRCAKQRMTQAQALRWLALQQDKHAKQAAREREDFYRRNADTPMGEQYGGE